MRAYNLFNRIQNSAILPFIICSVFAVLGALLQLAGYRVGGRADTVMTDFAMLMDKIIPYVFCYFVCLSFSKGRRWFRAFWSVLCLAFFATSFAGNITFFDGICMALFCSFFFNRYTAYTAMAVTAAVSVIFGLFFYTVSDFFGNAQMTVAYAISDKGIISSVLFGIISKFLSLFGAEGFDSLFFYKSCGGTVVADGGVITGIKDIFAAGSVNELVSRFMGGHFFFLFALAGIMLSLSEELKSAQKICLLVTVGCAIVSGNVSLAMFFIFLESPWLLLSALLLSGLSYCAGALLDIRIGYLFDGGIIEMIMNIDKPVYLLFGGLVFVAIGYFSAKYAVLKFGISDCLNIYIPTRLNKLVNSLGGIVNIIKVKDDTVEVRNPKLVNNFDIECEIRENLVKINDEKISELGEYL